MRNEEVLRNSQEGKEYFTQIKRRKADWNVRILRGKVLKKHIIKGKKEEKIEVTERRGRRRKTVLDDLKEKRRFLKLEAKALDRILWRTLF